MKNDLRHCRKPILLVILRLRLLPQTHTFSNFAALVFANKNENDIPELTNLEREIKKQNDKFLKGIRCKRYDLIDLEFEIY